MMLLKRYEYTLLLIGNVKDIIGQATSAQDEYMQQFDKISGYMYRNRIPAETIDRVRAWCTHTWKTQKSFDELAILNFLPLKVRGDVAADVHYKTLSNVKLFRGCNPGLLNHMVTRLRPMLFLPGDYICRRGDVGKEMFIINSGQVQVVGGPDDSIIFVTLKAGGTLSIIFQPKGQHCPQVPSIEQTKCMFVFVICNFRSVFWRDSLIGHRWYEQENSQCESSWIH